MIWWKSEETLQTKCGTPEDFLLMNAQNIKLDSTLNTSTLILQTNGLCPASTKQLRK